MRIDDRMVNGKITIDLTDVINTWLIGCYHG